MLLKNDVAKVLAIFGNLLRKYPKPLMSVFRPYQPFRPCVIKSISVSSGRAVGMQAANAGDAFAHRVNAERPGTAETSKLV
jgi:hypothetical protein